MTMGIHEICLAGTCRYCRQAIELRGISGGDLGPRWDGGWQTRPEPGGQTAKTSLCLDRMNLAEARSRPSMGIRHQPHRVSIELRSASGSPAGEAERIGVTRYAVMQKAPVSLFWPAGLLITGVPAGVEPAEVQAEIEAARRGWFLCGAIGAFLAHAELGPRSDTIQAEVEAAWRASPGNGARIFTLHNEFGLGCEIVGEAERRFAEIREDQVRVIDWERLVAAAQGRLALIRHDWQDLRTGGLPGLAHMARDHYRARTDRKHRIRELRFMARMTQ